MKTKNYLKNVAKHLFELSCNGEKTYMKVIVKNDTYRIIKFDQDLNLKDDNAFKFEETVSAKGKEYVLPELKNYRLFYKGYSPNFISYRTIKHFKSIKEKITKYDKEAKN
jgi:hypothetical protein